MSKEIIDIYGNRAAVDCIGCAIQEGKITRPGGSIILTEHFDAQQDVEIPIPGFIILASRRHLVSVDEFSDEQKQDFINTLCQLRLAMRKALDIKTVSLIQEEGTSDHFHLWLFPWYGWMIEKFPENLSSLRPIMEYARTNLKTKDNLNKVLDSVEKLRNYFQL